MNVGSLTYVCNYVWLFSLVILSHVGLIIRAGKIILRDRRKFLSAPLYHRVIVCVKQLVKNLMFSVLEVLAKSMFKSNLKPIMPVLQPFIFSEKFTIKWFLRGHILTWLFSLLSFLAGIQDSTTTCYVYRNV